MRTTGLHGERKGQYTTPEAVHSLCAYRIRLVSAATEGLEGDGPGRVSTATNALWRNPLVCGPCWRIGLPIIVRIYQSKINAE